MKRAYICSPYRGDVKRNKYYARQLCKWAILRGFTPICPHLYITEVLDDNDPTERETGRLHALELLGVCDVVIVGVSFGISEGMAAEIKHAELLGKEIKKIYIFS